MDIYKAPKAPVEDNPHDQGPGSVPKALLVGTVIDIGGTYAAAFIIMLLALLILHAQGLPVHDIRSALQMDNPNSPFAWMLNGVGFLMSVNAGYWCARIANRPGYAVPAVQGLLSVVCGYLLSPPTDFSPSALALDAASFVAVLLGALLYQRSRPAPAAS
jgi:hypothetical protein